MGTTAPSPGGMPGDEAAAVDDEGVVDGNAFGAPPPPPAEPASDATEVANVATDTASERKAAPLLIYKATLTLAVFEARDAMDAIEKLAKEAGGYLVSRNDLSIVVRVPAGKFDTALQKMSEQGDELHRDIEVSDVTEQYNDLEIELKNAEAVRERLAQLLDKAQNVEEALAVEEQLARLTDKIERIKGKLKLLRELVSFSTITVRFEARPVDKVRPNVELPFPWLKELGLPELLSL